MGNSKEILKSLKGTTPSKWIERSTYRKQNSEWLKKSQHIAAEILFLMERNNINQVELANRLGVSQQYISKLLKGSENISLETITKFENVFNCTLVYFRTDHVTNNYSETYTLITKINKYNTVNSDQINYCFG